MQWLSLAAGLQACVQGLQLGLGKFAGGVARQGIDQPQGARQKHRVDVGAQGLREGRRRETGRHHKGAQALNAGVGLLGLRLGLIGEAWAASGEKGQLLLEAISTDVADALSNQKLWTAPL